MLGNKTRTYFFGVTFFGNVFQNNRSHWLKQQNVFTTKDSVEMGKKKKDFWIIKKSSTEAMTTTHFNFLVVFPRVEFMGKLQKILPACLWSLADFDDYLILITHAVKSKKYIKLNAVGPGITISKIRTGKPVK